MTRIKFNSGMGAILCENCAVIMASGSDVPKHIMTNPSPNEHYFCSERCLEEHIERERRKCKIFTIKEE